MNMIQLLRKLLFKILNLSFEKNEIDLIVNTDVDTLKQNEVLRRINFFLGEYEYKINIKRLKKIPLLIYKPTIVLGFKETSKHQKLFRGYFYDFDYELNPLEAWEYHLFLNFLNGKVDFEGYRKKFVIYCESLKRQNLKKTYIFGTGPSLEKAIEGTWADGYRIVSNTIVKDRDLWQHINPDIITAGDGIYHFGIGDFAKNFRRDLKDRLSETDTIFMYPEMFHKFCLKEFENYKERLYPIPIHKHTSVHHNLNLTYSVPKLDNVLPLLLLPVACSLSKNIFLWGFDGRAPTDQDFWKNSNKQFYQEHVVQLKKLHPAFYNKQIPTNSEKSYVEKVHGQVLENVLSNAEKDGYNFEILHKTFTPVLAKRYKQL